MEVVYRSKLAYKERKMDGDSVVGMNGEIIEVN
jgi:hypothetical protein